MHQADPKAQLLLVLNSQAQAVSSADRLSPAEHDGDVQTANGSDAAAEHQNGTEVPHRQASAGEPAALPGQQGWASASIDAWLFGDGSDPAAADVFPAPRFLGTQGELAGAAPALMTKIVFTLTTGSWSSSMWLCICLAQLSL